jgi:rhamnulokinase
MPRSIFAAALDFGATSGRVILGRWQNQRLTLTEVHRFPNSFRTLAGHDYWDVGTLWHEGLTGLRQAVAALPRGATLASVGVDFWGVDHVLVNDAGRLVFPVHAYRDPRSLPGLKRLANTRAALDRIYAATGIPNVFYNSSLHLEETVAQCPAITDLATRCLFLPDYPEGPVLCQAPQRRIADTGVPRQPVQRLSAVMQDLIDPESDRAFHINCAGIVFPNLLGRF